MRNSFIILALILSFQGCFTTRGKEVNKEFGETTAYIDTINFSSVIVCPVEIEAEPNQEEWLKFLQDNLSLDPASTDTIPAGTFTVLAQFVIDPKGKLSNVSIIKDPGYGLGQRVAKAISRYEGLWEPADLNGRLIKSYRIQPITFIVEEEKEECENEFPPELIL